LETRSWLIETRDPVEAIVGAGARRLLGEKIASLEPPVDAAAVVVDAGVPGELAEPLLEGLRGAGLRIEARRLPGGEAAKSLQTLTGLWEWMLSAGLTRRSILVAVGGGAVTDTAGFAAATYMRGIRWATVPTTLLGMADAGVGGKTAVNLAGKNIVGAFHQPRVIVADVEFAQTLPEREYRSGLAEVAKHSLIRGGGFYAWIRGATGSLLERRQEALEKAVAESIDTKMEVVSRDPREEKGLRAVLNLGHTYAHALEKASGYTIPHGYAVAVGIAVENRVAERITGLREAEEIDELLESLGLPTRPPREPGCEETVRHIKLDKKRAGNEILLPLLEEPGKVALHRLPLREAQQLILEACSRLARQPGPQP
jgi:3-dehydroquinate synthase